MNLKEYTETVVPAMRRLFPFECKYNSAIEVESKEYELFAKLKSLDLTDCIQKLEQFKFETNKGYYPTVEDLKIGKEEKICKVYDDPNLAELTEEALEINKRIVYADSIHDYDSMIKELLNFKGKYFVRPERIDPRNPRAYFGYKKSELLALGVTEEEIQIYIESRKKHEI